MKGLFALLGVGFASTLIASSAAAQSTPVRYAACLMETHPALVRQFLNASTAEAANRRYRALVEDNHCFTRVFGDRQFRTQDAVSSIDVLRGTLAEHELMAKPGQVAALAPLRFQQKHYVRPWFAATGRHPAADEMGACAADTNPAGIVALIRTTPGSGNENSAIANLSPALAKCLSAGTRLDASREALRAALADALYQRLVNPALSLAAGTERGR